MQTPTTVLFILTDLRVGGMERKIAEIVQKVDRDRIRPIIACLKEPGALAPEVEAAGVPVHSRLLRHKFDLGVLVRLVRLMRREKVQVVCTTGDGGDRMFWGRLAARLAGVEGIVSTLHSTRNPQGGRIIDRPNRWLTPWNDAYVAVAKGAAKYLVEHEGLPADRVVVIYNGVDLEAFQGKGGEEIRASLQIPEDAPVVAHVAAFRTEKAHDLLLRAAARVLEKEPQTHVLLIGDGEERGNIERLRNDLGMEDRVHLLGRRTDIPDLLAASDFLVLCSNAMVETFPNSVLEAMASRLPVICTDVGSVDEQVFDGENGFLIAEGDEDALVSRMLTLIADPALRQTMGARARHIVEEQFSAQRMVGDRESLFTSLAGGTGIPHDLYSFSDSRNP